jgi:hypothetical protein
MRCILVAYCLAIFAACSSTPPPQPVVGNTGERIDREVPGTVHAPHIEPMIDTVQVPSQLDPEGNYYRPEHTTVYEIRPGRVQPVEFPPDEEEPKKRK